MIVLLLFAAVMTPYEVAFLQDSGTVGALFCVNIFLDFLFCLRMNPRAKCQMGDVVPLAFGRWRDVGRPLHSCDKDVVQAHHTSNHFWLVILRTARRNGTSRSVARP